MLQKYTQAELTQLATELTGLQPSAITARFIRDYRSLRDQCRAYEAR